VASPFIDVIFDLISLYFATIGELMRSGKPILRFIGLFLLLLSFIGIIVVVNFVITFLRDLQNL